MLHNAHIGLGQIDLQVVMCRTSTIIEMNQRQTLDLKIGLHSKQLRLTLKSGDTEDTAV